MISDLTSDPLKTTGWDKNHERAFWEQLLNQKINSYLIAFAVVAAGIIAAPSGTVSLVIQSAGVLILWILTLSIIGTAHKLNIVVKSLAREDRIPTALADRRLPGRFIQIVYGFVFPILCSTIITVSAAIGLSGVYVVNFLDKTGVNNAVDSSIVKPIEQAKDKLLEKPKVDESKYFKDVDSLTH